MVPLEKKGGEIITARRGPRSPGVVCDARREDLLQGPPHSRRHPSGCPGTSILAQLADDADVTDEGVIVRLREGRIVGLSILNATRKVLAAEAA